jgi:hypothetical protein
VDLIFLPLKILHDHTGIRTNLESWVQHSSKHEYVQKKGIERKFLPCEIELTWEREGLAVPEKIRSLVSFQLLASGKIGSATGFSLDLSDTGMHGGAPLIALTESTFLHFWRYEDCFSLSGWVWCRCVSPQYRFKVCTGSNFVYT